MIHGSSRIEDLTGISSITGPTGPTGAIGPGGTYGRTGPRGTTGFTGYGITGAYGTNTGGLYTHQIIFNLAGFEGSTYGWKTTAGTTIGVTGVRGATGNISSDEFVIWNTIGAGGITEDFSGNYGELFKERVGPIAHFRNLTISGRDIAVREPTDYMIMLGGITYGFGRMGITGELLFINPELGGLSAQGAPNTFWSGDQLTARILSHKESYNDDTTNNNLTQSVDNLAGNPINTSAVVSISNIDGTAVTFSSIFADQYNGEGGTAVASGIHMGGGTGGTIYKFAGVTFDTKFPLENIAVGSCCYCADGMDRPDYRDCVDYVTQTYCDGIGGNFSFDICMNRSEGPNCFSEGSCCVNGTCVATSEEKCQLFGGFFVEDLDCEFIDTELDGCPWPCAERGACCIDTECFNFTEHECSFFPNGVWLDKSCEDTNCCLEANYGACCVDEVCYHTSADMCGKLRTDGGLGPSTGIFWGSGSECAGLHLAKVDGIPNDDYSYESYYPFNCLDRTGGVTGELKNGKCVSDGTDPPCTGCNGWTQLMPEAGDCELDYEASYCLCSDTDCICEPQGDPPYRCVDTDSCGTLRLANGTCWECCKNQPDNYVALGSCCVEDVENEWQCIASSRATCAAAEGYFSIGSCDAVNCESGSCCRDFNCSMESAFDCIDTAGKWQGYSCNDTDCSGSGFRDYDVPESVAEPAALIGISPKDKKDKRVRRLEMEQGSVVFKPKEVKESVPKNQCPESTNISSCIEPDIVVAPSNKNHWTIEVGSGECSCCSPGVCWSGALGDGGIAEDCSVFGDAASPVTDCFSGNCKPNSSTKSYEIPSLPTNVKPICTNSQWETNELGCIPYVDVSKPEKPVWMVCSCCCKNGRCLQFEEPIPCSECEALGIDNDCKCVNGCNKCFN